MSFSYGQYLEKHSTGLARLVNIASPRRK